MVNIVVPIIDKIEEYQKSINAIANNKNFKLIIGIDEDLVDKFEKPNAAIMRVFRRGSTKEAIINSLKNSVTKGRLIVCRRAWTKNELDNMLKCEGEICYVDKPQKNKVFAWVKSVIGSLIKLIFGVKFFDGDISLISFDENLSEVLQNVKSLSYSTRVDRWRGVEKGTIKGELPPVKIENNKMSNMRLIIYAILSLAIPVIVTVLVAIFAQVNFVIGMLLFCINVLGVSGMIILLLSFYLNHTVGQRFVYDAIEL